MLNSYVSIDIETTGVTPDRGHILEFGAILDDGVSPIEELKTFRRLVVTNDGMIGGEPAALAMNVDLISEINERLSSPEDNWLVVTANRLIPEFKAWLGGIEPITIAGKNFANFDLGFLNGLGFSKFIRYHHRILDPGNLFWSYAQDGYLLPDTETCMARGGIAGSPKHRALDDARLVVELIRARQER